MPFIEWSHPHSLKKGGGQKGSLVLAPSFTTRLVRCLSIKYTFMISPACCFSRQVHILESFWQHAAYYSIVLPATTYVNWDDAGRNMVPTGKHALRMIPCKPEQSRKGVYRSSLPSEKLDKRSCMVCSPDMIASRAINKSMW